MANFEKVQHCKFCNQLFAKPFVLSTIDVALLKKCDIGYARFYGKMVF